MKLMSMVNIKHTASMAGEDREEKGGGGKGTEEEEMEGKRREGGIGSKTRRKRRWWRWCIPSPLPYSSERIIPSYAPSPVFSILSTPNLSPVSSSALHSVSQDSNTSPPPVPPSPLLSLNPLPLPPVPALPHPLSPHPSPLTTTHPLSPHLFSSHPLSPSPSLLSPSLSFTLFTRLLLPQLHHGMRSKFLLMRI